MLKEAEAGVPITELVRKHGISRIAYFNRKSRYSGAEISELRRLRDELALEIAAIKDLLQRRR